MASERALTKSKPDRMKSKPGRKPRYSTEQLRDRTLRAAVDSVLQHGVAGGVDSVRIEHVIVDADVPRAPVYEFWDKEGTGTPQQNLRRAAILHFLRDLPVSNLESIRAMTFQIVAEHSEALGSGRREAIDAIRNELVRTMCAYSFGQFQSQDWRIFRALTTSVGTREDPELHDAVAEGEERLLRAYTELFDDLAQILRLRPKPPFSTRDFTVAVYALEQGLSNRVTFCRDEDLGPPLTIDGADWTLFAAALHGLSLHFFEPIEDDKTAHAVSLPNETD